MISTTFEHIHQIGDTIYHVAPDSGKGKILDISYSALYNIVKYYVTFSHTVDGANWYLESELSTEPIF